MICFLIETKKSFDTIDSYQSDMKGKRKMKEIFSLLYLLLSCDIFSMKISLSNDMKSYISMRKFDLFLFICCSELDFVKKDLSSVINRSDKYEKENLSFFVRERRKTQ